MKLNLGCGKDIRMGYVNLDFVAAPGIDVIWDLEKFPYPFEDNTFDEVYAANIIEHLTDAKKTIIELHRICKNNAIMKINVPHAMTPLAWGDITHKRVFSSESFKHYVLGSEGDTLETDLILFSERKLELKFLRSTYLTLIPQLVNRSFKTQGFFERLCPPFIIPYGAHFELKVLKK